MSPIGRVKAALAGATISVWAVRFTLLEIAENGRPTTNSTEPTAVATIHAGLMTIVSATTFKASSSLALAGAAMLRQTAKAQIVLSLLVLIFSQASVIIPVLSSRSGG
jgi:hypothetical protein